MPTTATLPDGRTVEIEDGQTALEAYYVGQGATLTKTLDSLPSLPRVFNGGDGYEGETDPQPIEQLPAGQFAALDGEVQRAGETAAQPQGEPPAVQPSDETLVGGPLSTDQH